MQIGAIGYNYTHKGDFEVNKPGGVGSSLLLIVKEPSVFILNGKEATVDKGSFILLSWNTPVIYRGASKVYTDDWIYLVLTDEDFGYIKELGIELDTPYFAGNTDEASQIIRTLAYEHLFSNERKTEVEEHYLKILLIKLSRLIISPVTAATELNDNSTAFMQLRSSIYITPENVPSVAELAKSMGLSTSAFEHLYKKLFGINIKNDVALAKIERAKRLLASTNLSVKEIGERCGYNDIYGFMKKFKAVVGKTPTEYRSII